MKYFSSGVGLDVFIVLLNMQELYLPTPKNSKVANFCCCICVTLSLQSVTSVFCCCNLVVSVANSRDPDQTAP